MEVPAEGLGLPENEQQALHENWDTYRGVIARITQEGFRSLSQPIYAYPEYLDFNILTAHDSKTLTLELAKNKAWRDFADQRKAYTDMLLTETKNELSAIEMATKRSLKATSKKKTLTKDEVTEYARMEPRYLQLKRQEQEQEQFKIYYSAESSRLSSNYSLISRVITMRGQDIEQGNRAVNIGAHGTGAGDGHPARFP